LAFWKEDSRYPKWLTSFSRTGDRANNSMCHPTLYRNRQSQVMFLSSKIIQTLALQHAFSSKFRNRGVPMVIVYWKSCICNDREGMTKRGGDDKKYQYCKTWYK
jgi:hypothetical protein